MTRNLKYIVCFDVNGQTAPSTVILVNILTKLMTNEKCLIIVSKGLDNIREQSSLSA